MNIHNKLKFSLSAVSFLLIAFYTYCLFSYGGKYLSGTEYIIQTGISVLFSIPLILITKYFYTQKKALSLLAASIIPLLTIFVISDFTGTAIKQNAKMLITGLWPFICYAVAKLVGKEKLFKHRSFLLNFVCYSIIIMVIIWFLEEVTFKYKYISADVISQMYMYAVSVIAFLVYNLKIKKINPDKKDVFYIVATIAVIIYFWVCSQERIDAIIESLSFGNTDIDADGDLLNWYSHRISMLKSSIHSDFSNINTYRFLPMMKNCSLAMLSYVGSWFITAVIIALSIVTVCLITAYARKCKNSLITIVSISFIIKLVIGITTNLFLIYSTSVGIPFITNPYDIFVLIIIIFGEKLNFVN